MRISYTFIAIWALVALAQSCVCVFIVREKLTARWPSLFVLMLDEALAFFVLLAVHKNYRIYFQTYWWNLVAVSLLRIWLAIDIARSMPANRLFPQNQRVWILCFAALLGAATWWAFNQPYEDSALRSAAAVISRAVTFTWVTIFLALVIGVIFSGFGFDITTVRVISGELVRLASFSVASAIYVWTSLRSYRTLTAEIDTAVSGGVAVYICYALARARREESREREEYLRLFPE